MGPPRGGAQTDDHRRRRQSDRSLLRKKGFAAAVVWRRHLGLPWVDAAKAFRTGGDEEADALNVLYIHQYFTTPRGRSGTRSYEQARAMVRDGHDVTILTTPAQLTADEWPAGAGGVGRTSLDGLPVIVLDVPYAQRMSHARRIRSFLEFMVRACAVVLREPRLDLVFATSTPLTVGIPALVGKLVRGLPYVFEVRDLWPAVPAGLGLIRNRSLLRALEATEEMIYRHARAVVAVNGDVAREIRRTTGGRRRPVVVPNACDVELFRPDRDGMWFRRRHRLEDKVLAVHAGAMGPVNGLMAILDAASALRDRAPDLHFLIVGEGSMKEPVAERVAREGLDNVSVLDAVPKTELADVLATADVGLMTVAPIPLLQWNCANKFFDYLAAGLPMVLNYRGWQAAILEGAGCGLAAPQGDTDGFARSIEALATDTRRRAEMAARARQVAETQYNRSAVVAPLLWLLRRIEGRSGAGAAD